jgi:acyl-CoA thioester hydrolase
MKQDLHRGLFPHWTLERARYGDTDRQGHVNNARFATYLESGRVDLFHAPDVRAAVPEGTEFVIVRLTLDFLAEIHWRSGRAGLGRSSFTLHQAIFRGEKPVARAESVLVLLDGASRRAHPLPPELRAALERYALRETKLA